MGKKFCNFIFSLFLIALLALTLSPSAAFAMAGMGEESAGMQAAQNSMPTAVLGAQTGSKAVIYYNVACTMCAMYLEEEMIPLLQSYGITDITKKDYVNSREYRAEFNSESERLGIPMQLQAHFATFIDDRIFLEGHVPAHVTETLLSAENISRFGKIVVYQDAMEGATAYRVWAFKGEVKEYSLNAPITEYLGWFEQNKDALQTPPELLSKRLSWEVLLPLVLVTGFLDGINPCAFGVLLFFIAFLYAIKRSKGHIIKIGLAYVSMIYLAYLLIGLGILQAIAISGVPHLFGIVSSVLIVALGLLNIKDFFWEGRGPSLKIPHVTKKYIVEWMHKGTLPAALVLGFLVGLCTFPCSGSIYVAILALLSVQTTYLEGLAYLLVYNVMFVVPLLIILAMASSKRVVERMEGWEREHKRWMKLGSGILMIALGVILWYFSVPM